MTEAEWLASNNPEQMLRHFDADSPHPWRKPPIKLRLGGGIDTHAGRRNAARQRGILEACDVLGHAGSITAICRDV